MQGSRATYVHKGSWSGTRYQVPDPACCAPQALLSAVRSHSLHLGCSPELHAVLRLRNPPPPGQQALCPAGA